MEASQTKQKPGKVTGVIVSIFTDPQCLWASSSRQQQPVSGSCFASILKQSESAHQSARGRVRPLLPRAAFAGLHLNQGLTGAQRSATWTRLMSLSRHTDLCCNTHGRHHKLSHQFSPIGCGMSWLTQFVEKCTCLCLPSL